MPRGKAFSEAQKTLILERDSYTCAYCGGPAGEVDHVNPRSNGGNNLIENGVAVCVRCNGVKGAKLDIAQLTRGFYVALTPIEGKDKQGNKAKQPAKKPRQKVWKFND